MNAESIQRAQTWLTDLLSLMGYPTTISVEQPAFAQERLNHFGGCWLTVEPDKLKTAQINALTTADGEALDAIQYLLNVTLNLGQSAETQEAYTVELNQCREHHYSRLIDLAEEAAATARQTQSEFEMPPLTAAERRLVHTLLVSEPNLETFSQGEGAQRRLIVRYVSGQDS
ncbi:RNA-binding protein [Synechococcales cyanobacterium C]|uniref:RNA-binding protein n=1 Tax=Petrachloros mirabilis ULC683 TaxID=2781853 RepID=A0A8K1ZXZ6_9CYAN|nr:R3H domain-containing nucleic acid-binding protein [Petrachloros mirabilis]NCJ06192.1 RNA-binding protein [Petrachloros mirabilis ULC683]